MRDIIRVHGGPPAAPQLVKHGLRRRSFHWMRPFSPSKCPTLRGPGEGFGSPPSHGTPGCAAAVLPRRAPLALLLLLHTRRSNHTDNEGRLVVDCSEPERGPGDWKRATPEVKYRPALRIFGRVLILQLLAVAVVNYLVN